MTSAQIAEKYNQSTSAKGQFAYLHVGLTPKDSELNAKNRFKIRYSDSKKGKYDALLELEDSSKISFSFENEYEYPIDVLTGKTQSTANLVVQAIQAGNNIMSNNAIGKTQQNQMDSVFTSIYKSVPAYKGTSTLKIPDTLTFTFYYGQKGFFDCFTEVVVPIICLAAYFLPTRNGGSLTDLPFPTSPKFLTSAMSSILAGSSGATEYENNSSSSEGSEVEVDEAEKANQELNGKMESGNSFIKVAETIVSKLDSALGSSYDGSKFCQLELLGFTKIDKDTSISGSLKTPVFSVGKVGFSFDMSETVNGYPMSGKLTLSDIQTPKVANKTDIGAIER